MIFNAYNCILDPPHLKMHLSVTVHRRNYYIFLKNLWGYPQKIQIHKGQFSLVLVSQYIFNSHHVKVSCVHTFLFFYNSRDILSLHQKKSELFSLSWFWIRRIRSVSDPINIIPESETPKSKTSSGNVSTDFWYSSMKKFSWSKILYSRQFRILLLL